MTTSPFWTLPVLIFAQFYTGLSADIAPATSRLGLNAEIELLKDLTKQWVETEKVRSKEKSQAHEQLQNLEQLQAVLKTQLSDWKEKVNLIEKSVSRADRERQDLVSKKDSLAQRRQMALGFLERIERELRALEPMMPKPLKMELEKPLRQLGNRATDELWLQRYQACLSIIKGMRSFHRRYTTGAQDIDLEGDLCAVRVLYVGLTSAYFMSLDGRQTGIGVPSSEGWRWRATDDFRSEIQLAFKMAEQSSTQLSLVELPVEIK